MKLVKQNGKDDLKALRNTIRIKERELESAKRKGKPGDKLQGDLDKLRVEYKSKTKK